MYSILQYTREEKGERKLARKEKGERYILGNWGVHEKGSVSVNLNPSRKIYCCHRPLLYMLHLWKKKKEKRKPNKTDVLLKKQNSPYGQVSDLSALADFTKNLLADQHLQTIQVVVLRQAQAKQHTSLCPGHKARSEHC